MKTRGILLAVLALSALVHFALASWIQAAVLADYRFETGPDGGSVGSIIDSGPHGLNGIVGGTLTYTSNVPTVDGGKFALNASGDFNFGKVADSPFLDPAGDFTIEAYARPDSSYVSTNDEDKVVQKKNGEAGTDLSSYEIRYYSGSRQFTGGISLGGGTGVYIQGGVIAPDQWHHLALVFHENGVNDTVSFYVDHVLQGTSTGNYPIAYTTNDFVIGAGNFGTPDGTGTFRRNFGGLIDEVRLSDQALTPDQFLANVPEPSSLSLVGAAVLLVAHRKRRAEKKGRSSLKKMEQ